MRLYRAFPTLLAIATAFAVPAASQTTFASLTGTITDQTGAVVAGVPIVAVHAESNYRYTGQSNAAGAYTIGQLREGVYTVTVQSPGFKQFVASNVQLV